MKYCAILFLCVLVTDSISAQTTPATDKPRVFITDSQSWEMESNAAGTNGTFAGHSAGGARPQTAEIIKTFGERCPGVMVNNMRGKADYIVVLDHEGGKSYLRHKNKVAVFEARGGDAIVSKSTLSLGGSVEDACKAISKHWSEHKSAISAPVPATKENTPATAPELKQPVSHLSVVSAPDGADIEIDGSFMGSTPSAIVLALGDHSVSIKKNGYKAWERKLKISGGDVSLKAELEKETASNQ